MPHHRSRSDIMLTRAAALLLLGNLLDALFTLTLLQLNLVSEANPFMRWVYGHSPVSFMLLKLSCVQFGLLILWAQRHVPAAGLAIQAGAGLYLAVVAYHFTLMAQLPV
jgi:polyferredoxin